MKEKTALITGAFSYSGKYIARRLIQEGYKIRTLTYHTERKSPFKGDVEVYKYRFDDEEYLTRVFSGVDVFYNTYWIRFPKGKLTYEGAVANTEKLIKSAGRAGVRRIVHISITNADKSSDLPYFRGKGEIEEMIKASGMSYAIIRPTVIYSEEDILINNITWFLRKFPVFLIPGDGSYQVQPVYVEDLAEIAVRAGKGEENEIIDAVGPERYSFEELIKEISGKLGVSRMIIHTHPFIVYFLVKVVGYIVGDVILTMDEIKGLMRNLLVSENPPTGTTRFSEWLQENIGKLGVMYHSELKRHYALRE